jgi:hypothetical protein
MSLRFIDPNYPKAGHSRSKSACHPYPGFGKALSSSVYGILLYSRRGGAYGTGVIDKGTPHRGYGDFKAIIIGIPAWDHTDEFFCE